MQFNSVLRAYVFPEIDRSDLNEVWDSLANCPGIRAACEFMYQRPTILADGPSSYTGLDDDKQEIYIEGCMRIREVIGVQFHDSISLR